MPTTFAESLALVQKLQKVFEGMPNGTLAEQRARWEALQKLERAKQWAAEIQQGPKPQSITEAAESLRTLDEKVRLQPIDGIRAEVQARLKARR